MQARFLMLLLVLPARSATMPSVPELRQLYRMAASSESSARMLSSIVAGFSPDALPIYQCYKGASFFMEAKYAENPFVKFHRFRSGKTLIERAIAREQGNVEMRLLRYSIQVSLPVFLGYNSNRQADKAFLLSRMPETKDENLRALMRTVLSEN